MTGSLLRCLIRETRIHLYALRHRSFPRKTFNERGQHGFARARARAERSGAGAVDVEKLEKVLISARDCSHGEACNALRRIPEKSTRKSNFTFELAALAISGLGSALPRTLGARKRRRRGALSTVYRGLDSFRLARPVFIGRIYEGDLRPFITRQVRGRS